MDSHIPVPGRRVVRSVAAVRICLGIDLPRGGAGVPGEYDVFTEDADKDEMAKERKRRFEPVGFRCRKTVLRLK